MHRRSVLKGAALSALAYSVAGIDVLLTPREARGQAIPLRVLTSGEQETIEALGETLLPGAKDAGIAHYVDHQLAVPVGECLLVARSMGLMPPFAGFYRAGLAALNAVAMRAHGSAFAALSPDARHMLVDRFRQAPPDGWTGPPSPLFYTVTRTDAVDVVYGTVEGFERLGVPYMPHVLPPTRW